jgi:hypothetical protein
VLLDTTERYKKLTSLNPKQQRAVELFVVGASDQEVAKAVGVHRVTACRWRLHHPAVRAEINLARKSLERTQLQGLAALSSKALAALSAALDAPGPAQGRLALEILRLQLVRDSPGLTEAEDIVNAEVANRRPSPARNANPQNLRAAIDELYRKAMGPEDESPGS